MANVSEVMLCNRGILLAPHKCIDAVVVTWSKRLLSVKCGTGMPGAVNLPTDFEEVTVLVLFNSVS